MPSRKRMQGTRFAAPASLRSKIGEMILSSTIARAKVEAINTETGEYRVVLQGTLDKEEGRFEEK